MPVLDHEVHPSTKVGPEYRYGCWNKPRPGNLVNMGGKFGLRTFRMSRDCRYDMSISDPNCTDCKHRGNGEAYAESVREVGA